MDSQIAPDEEFLRLPLVKQRSGLSTPTLYRMMADGRFPKPRKYQGTQSNFWLASEVRQWQQQQVVG